ncbi:MAG TPA: HAD family hydrolase [Gaiellales bacterium]|nr:HAD family hydrolase [Gaiellales bacterium]
MTGLRAVLLDLDDTLLPDSGAFLAAAAALADELGAPPELAEAVRRAARTAWRAGPHFTWFQTIGVSSWEGLWAPLGGADGRMPAIRAWASGYRRSAWSEALSACGLGDALAERAADGFAGHRQAACAPYPDALPALRRLREAGLATVIVTNGMADLQRLKAEHAGLLEQVDGFVVSGDVGAGKPDPRVFQAALERAGARADQTLMVGDNPIRDVAGAQRLGIRTAWLDRDGGDDCGVVADHRITTLAALPLLPTP